MDNIVIGTHPKRAILDLPGARLHYEIRGQGPLIALVGAPMDAAAFAPLADHLATGHTVLTCHPRGIRRGTVTDPDADFTPETRASDLARLLDVCDAGPATDLGSSGEAATALTLVQKRPYGSMGAWLAPVCTRSGIRLIRLMSSSEY